MCSINYFACNASRNQSLCKKSYSQIKKPGDIILFEAYVSHTLTLQESTQKLLPVYTVKKVPKWAVVLSGNAVVLAGFTKREVKKGKKELTRVAAPALSTLVRR